MKITFLPSGKSIIAGSGESLLELCRLLGLSADAPCGGQGRCGKCTVLPVSGELSPMDENELWLLGPEKAAAGLRLACRAVPLTDCTVNLTASAPDASAKTVPAALPRSFSPDKGIGKYGVACDIGTTSLAVLLWDMELCSLLASESGENPQGVYGADVISRIAFASKSPDNLTALRTAVLRGLNLLIEKAAASAGIRPESISRAAAVGNTAMSHLFLGRDPSGLAFFPFSPAFRGPVSLTAREAGLCIQPEGEVYVMPNIESHVGSDITAGLLLCRPDLEPGLQVFADVGTNGEIAASENGSLFVCSTAAGPAFEGASIKCGMRAAPGAVCSADISAGDVVCRTVDQKAPAGVCGSGLIDAIALLLDTGAADSTGRLASREEALRRGVPGKIAERLVSTGGEREFLLCSGLSGPIVITQRDIRSVQLVKSAVRSGIDLLTGGREIDRLTVAGAFGSRINLKSAVRLGLFPPVPPGRIVSAGSAAVYGASMALMSGSARNAALELLRRVEHVELASDGRFQELFIKNMSF